VRFSQSELAKWKKEVENFNAGCNGWKTLDPKKDKSPGPAHYCMINGWKGKKLNPKSKLAKMAFPPILSKISQAPVLGIYHSTS
jgi:hypothetical protein